MLSQPEPPPFERGITWSTVRLVLRAAVHALPAVAREHRAAGDLALVAVARDAHVGHEPDHDRLRQRAGGPVQVGRADLDDLGLLLQQQHRRAAHRADVDRLVRRVEDQHTTTRPTASAVGIRSVPPVIVTRHGPQWWSWGAAIPWLPGSVASDADRLTPPETTRERAPPRRARAGRRRRPRPPRRPSRPSRSRKNMYSPSRCRSGRDSIRVRLTLALREHGQAAHQPARARRAGAPEHERGLAGPVAGCAGAVPGAGDPDEAGLVAGVVLDVLAQDHAAVALGGAAGADRRRAGLEPAGHLAHRVGGRAARPPPARAGQRLAQEARALAAAPAGATRPLAPRRARAARRRGRSGGPAGAARRRSPRRRSRTRARRASGRPPPSSEFSIGTSARSTSPSWTASTASCSVGSGTSSNASAPAAAAAPRG